MALSLAQAAPATELPTPQGPALAAQGVAKPGQRLSEAVLETTASSASAPSSRTPYPLGLMWLSPRAQAEQRREKQALLNQLPSWAAQQGVPTAQAQRVQERIAAMPVTGRLALAVQDPHWLQGQTDADPLLADGDAWWLPARPRFVRVWFDTGRLCDAEFRSEAQAHDYVKACAEVDSAEARADRAVIVQPDARRLSVNLAAWNANTQASPAPGAWLWVRSAGSRWPEAADQAVAQWLATQGPAGLFEAPSEERAASLRAADLSPTARTLPLSPSQWGITGLLQTPTARSPQAGHYGLVIAHASPYTQYNLMLSPFDRVEVGLRYTKVGTALYGPAIAGDQSYKDKSAEIKLRLLDEGPWRPALAVGLRDTGGTGLFAGEYLVASKRWRDFDVNFGIGWGYFGASQRWRNPLGFLGSRFETRTAPDVGQGGTFEPGAIFTGRVAPFGGVQWHTPWDGVLLKLEHEGNDYQREPFGQRLPARSPLNAAVVWQFGAGELSLGLVRGGQKAALSLALYGSLPSTSTPKLAVPKPADVPPSSLVGAGLLAELSRQTGWRAHTLERGATRWVARFDDAGGTYVQDRLDRAFALLHRQAPPQVSTLAIELAERQLPQVRHEVDRHTWAQAKTEQAWSPPGERRVEQALADSRRVAEPQAAAAAPEDILTLRTPRTRWSTSVGYQQHLGGPDGYLFALVGRASGQLTLWPGAWAQGTVQINLVDNYDRFRYDAPSELPRVRTRLREYVTESGLTMPNLQLTQAVRLGNDVYGMVYAGYLESMFAGVGGEVLWRPLNSRVALGVDLNRVRQREPSQGTGLTPYRVSTGHVTAYWDTGWKDVVAQVSAGQYLAGDRGTTLELTRVFPNGTRIGAWATKTNVSAAQFGEGSFDKGVYFSIPFEAMFTSWSNSTFSLAWQPLIRDGGAKLRRSSLWSLTDMRDRRAAEYQAPGP
jgi:hypothetical protein